MSVKRPVQFLTLTVCLLLLPACAKKASEEIDFGTVQNSVYQNKYFGFKINLPPDWNVQDQEARQQLTEAGTKMVVGNDRRMKAIVRAAEHRTVNLLSVFQHPIGSRVQFNPSVICMAERVGKFSGIKHGRDYHAAARRLMESSQMKVEFEDKITVEELGGVKFDVMQSSLTVGAVTVQQKYYAAIMKDYALVFITSYTTPDHKTALQNILQTLAFN
jgi:hypothetical protein